MWALSNGGRGQMSLHRFGLAGVVLLLFISTLTLGPSISYASTSEQGRQEIEVRVLSTPQEVEHASTERSWYGDSFSFSRSYSTSSHYYDGSSVGIEVTASCPSKGSFSVMLYRNGSFISSATLNRNGFSRAEWKNVGPGSYSFTFSKSNDGTIVKCSDVAMFSW